MRSCLSCCGQPLALFVGFDEITGMARHAVFDVDLDCAGLDDLRDGGADLSGRRAAPGLHVDRHRDFDRADDRRSHRHDDVPQKILAVSRRVVQGHPEARRRDRSSAGSGQHTSGRQVPGVGDLQGAHPFEPDAYDVIFSRLGVMFFEEPDAAFANLHRALRRDGRLGFLCWRSLEDNGWTTEPRDAVASIVPLPPPPPADAPGPFSLGSEERIRLLLSTAGFVEVVIEPHDEPLLIGRGCVEEAIEFYLRLLPTGHLMFEPDRHLLDRIRVTLRTVLEKHHGPEGIWLGSGTWNVRAR